MTDIDSNKSPQPNLFRCTGYLWERTDGKLRITSIDESCVCVLDQRLPMSPKAFQIGALVSVTWSDFEPDVVFTYAQETKDKSISTWINSAEDRDRMLTILQGHFPRPFRFEEESANPFRVALGRFIGSAVFGAISLLLYHNWDQNYLEHSTEMNKIAALIGQTGFCLLGLGAAAFMLISATVSILKKPKIHHIFVQP